MTGWKKAFVLFLTMTVALTAFAACKKADPVTEESTPSPAPVTPEPIDTAKVLGGRSVLFCGDSICMASTYDTEHQFWGWAGRIDRDYGLGSYVNAGVDGASVSTCRGSNTVIYQLRINKKNTFDTVVLHGGVNDAWDSAPVGNMVEKPASETTSKDLDQSTFAGGLENLFIKAKEYFPDAKIMYIINFRLNSHIGSMWDMTDYWKEAKKICEKYDIPYLDLYENADFEAEFKNLTDKNLADGIHPNSDGYEILSRYIAPFMAKVITGLD